MHLPLLPPQMQDECAESRCEEHEGKIVNAVLCPPRTQMTIATQSARVAEPGATPTATQSAPASQPIKKMKSMVKEKEKKEKKVKEGAGARRSEDKQEPRGEERKQRRVGAGEGPGDAPPFVLVVRGGRAHCLTRRTDSRREEAQHSQARAGLNIALPVARRAYAPHYLVRLRVVCRQRQRWHAGDRRSGVPQCRGLYQQREHRQYRSWSEAGATQADHRGRAVVDDARFACVDGGHEELALSVEHDEGGVV